MRQAEIDQQAGGPNSPVGHHALEIGQLKRKTSHKHLENFGNENYRRKMTANECSF